MMVMALIVDTMGQVIVSYPYGMDFTSLSNADG